MSNSSAATPSRILKPNDQAAALGETSGQLAHDFNNLLAVIAGSASLIDITAGGATDIRRHIHNIQAATARGTRIMQQLLALSPRIDGSFEALAPGKLLEEARVAAEASCAPSISLTAFAAPGLPEFSGDSRQVLMTLAMVIENARDAMPEGGSILLTARLKEIPPGGAGDGAATYIAFSVEDSGPGFSEDALARAGEIYFTTKPKGKGAGLGLAIVNRMVRRHRGFVLLENCAGGGARVTCHYPVQVGAT